MAEKSAGSAGKIEVNWPTDVTIGGTLHRIRPTTELIRPTPEYTIEPFQFEDLSGEKTDGSLFKIRPKGSSRVMLITDPDNTGYKSQRIAFGGSGWCLRVYDDEMIDYIQIGPNWKNNPLIELKKGEIDCFIAGENLIEGEENVALEVVDISEPPFNIKVEKELLPGDERAPKEFWKLWAHLKGISIPPTTS